MEPYNEIHFNKDVSPPPVIHQPEGFLGLLTAPASSCKG